MQHPQDSAWHIINSIHMWLFFFNWSIIALQCCVSLCYTTKWVGSMYIYIHSLLSLPPPIPPLQVITEHLAELPVLYSCFPLVICFIQGSVYMSNLISQSSHLSFPQPHSHSIYTCLFSTSVSLFLLWELVHLYHFSMFHIQAIIYDICFLFLTSLCMTVSRSIQVSTDDPISFLFMRPHGMQPTRLLYPWNFPGKNTGVGNPSLHQGISSTQGLNPDLLDCRWVLHHLSHQGSPPNMECFMNLHVILAQGPCQSSLLLLLLSRFSRV